MFLASNSKKLYRYDVVTKKATLLIGNVDGFGVEDRFLFTTIQHPKVIFLSFFNNKDFY